MFDLDAVLVEETVVQRAVKVNEAAGDRTRTDAGLNRWLAWLG